MGYYTIYWPIYRDPLFPCTQQRPEQVELIEIMREPFLVSRNLNYITPRVNPFRAYHLAGKQFIRPTPPTTVRNRTIQNTSAKNRPTPTYSKRLRQRRTSIDSFEPTSRCLLLARIDQTRSR